MGRKEQSDKEIQPGYSETIGYFSEKVFYILKNQAMQSTF